MERKNSGNDQEDQRELKLMTLKADEIEQLFLKSREPEDQEAPEEDDEVPNFVKDLKSRICFIQGF